MDAPEGTVTLAYFRERVPSLLVNGLFGIALVAFAVASPRHMRGFLSVYALINPFLTSPYRLRNVAGRPWWVCYYIGVGGAALVAIAGVRHVFGVIGSIVTFIAWGIVFCLRWKPPPGATG